MNEYSEEQKKRIKEAFLKSLNNGVTLDKAAESAGVTRATIWNWRNIDEEFNNAINETINSRTQTMEDALFQSGVKGNVVAQIFWLKNRSKGRWKDKQEIEHSGKIELNNLTDEEIDEYLDRLSEKRRTNDKDGEEKKED
jgi:AcrR family transcriptional regulator